MGTSLFGTDGVRGVANRTLTPELSFDLVRCGTEYFLETFEVPTGGRPRVVIGRDTRRSGDMLTAAAVAGATSAGADVLSLGIVPTPAVAHAVVACPSAVVGIMISASHNPPEYNGVKFFDPEGHKLDVGVEKAIETRVAAQQNTCTRPGAMEVGTCLPAAGEVHAYLTHLVGAAGEGLSGLRVLLDCANGAGYRLGPAAFRGAEASVTVLFDEPDGFNINEGCGSTHPESLQGAMLAGDYDIGFSLDGDADRVVAVSPSGRLFDGDDILYILARDLQHRGRLTRDALVTAVTNNWGLDASLRPFGIEVTHCSVGDREIMQTMGCVGARLGGETSGHIIIADHATAGDGILTAVMVSSVMARTGESAEDLLDGLVKYPQVTRNVPVANKEGFAEDEEISRSIGEAEDRLGDEGRLVIRPSGTEPVVRVMVECPCAEEAEDVAESLAELVKQRLG